MSFVCRDCGKSELIEDYTNGDIVCRCCGLVAEGHTVMTDAYYNPSFYNDHGYIYEDDEFDHGLQKTTIVSKAVVYCGEKQNNEDIENNFRSACINLCLSEETQKEAKKMFESIRDKYIFRGQPLKASIACSIYIALNLRHKRCILRDAKEIYEPLGIDPLCFNKTLKMIYKMFPDYNNSMLTIQEEDTLARQVREIDEIPEEKVRLVIKHVRLLDEMRKEKKIMMGSSPTIVNAILIYVVACHMLQISLNKTLYIKIGWVSRATLDKYVKIINEIVPKNNPLIL